MMEQGSAPWESTRAGRILRACTTTWGGTDNYAVDREAAAVVLRRLPETLDIARENPKFLQRAVRYLVGEPGLRQIIDIGTGIPAAGNVDEIVQQIDPGVRVVYVDNDPVVQLRAPRPILDHPDVRKLIAYRVL